MVPAIEVIPGNHEWEGDSFGLTTSLSKNMQALLRWSETCGNQQSFARRMQNVSCHPKKGSLDRGKGANGMDRLPVTVS